MAPVWGKSSKPWGTEHEINSNNEYARTKYPDLFEFFLANLKE
jgi:hypothetical protein